MFTIRLIATGCLVLCTGSAMAQPLPPLGSVETFKADCGNKLGGERLVQYYVPRSYTGATPMPVVFALHGGGLTAQSMYADRAGIKDTAEAQGFIAVFPNGRGTGDALHWTDNDVYYIDCLMTIVGHKLNVDGRRRYVVGFSAGGKLAFQLAANPLTSYRIAGIATAAAMMGKKGTEPPTSEWEIHDPNLVSDPLPQYPNGARGAPMPAVLLQGALDPKHPLNGGYTAASKDVNFSFQMIVDLVRLRIGAEVDTPVNLAQAPRAQVHYHSQPGAPNGRAVLSIVDPGLGHAWPTDWPYMAVIWDFFRAMPAR